MTSAEGKPRRLKRAFSWVMIILLIGLVLFTVLFALTMFVSVGVGHAAVLVDPWAKTVSEPKVGPTWIVKAPWVQAVDIMVATDTLGMWGDGRDPSADLPTVYCFSRDQLEMAVDIMLRWRLDVAKLKELYQSLPQKNWKNDVIASVAREQIRLVTKEFTTIQTIEQRDLVAQTIRDAIWDKLSTEASLAGAITNFEFELRNIGYPEQYTQAIIDKQAAEQAMLKAEFERQTVIIMANATAQQVIIEANAEAEAKVLVANGTREAIELILEASGGDPTNATRIAELYLWVETLKQIAPDIDVFITSEDIPYLISIPTS
ncbi:MAG: SPFH domain-containing protein [Candidatus Bathyarchaeota archaeon]|nr:SPFH domain-containing protein [Candidatus Bathyarchaeota archaeon]MDH5636634.1 SPFH domain-containing protein [Candidatus Bathyarchaeota archaeon]